ncbi:sensor histidine kinase [Streptomyces solincola]|uniref:sensor histidine kinase n=1 Tax=Streptomyces solincola TaxID=2100817 RepID=UPI0021590D44|nr:GAF domain-containing protein [Streptomyces solincola]
MSAQEPLPPVPQLRLDELLDELQVRINSARGTRDRVHSLLQAVVSVGSGLDLHQVLHRIAEAAAFLVDAEYAALGVIGPDGRTLSQFLTVGLSHEEVERIGHLPSGHGLLGELIRNPEPLRLSDIKQHPASYGFPAHHPPMRSFLGVPVRVRDKVYGNLYLTDKRGGREFDAEDEAVISTLAVAAGVAVDNARLYASARRRQQWLRANAEVTSSLLSGSPRGEVLDLIARRAGDIAGAALADVAVCPAGEGGDLVVELATGGDARARRGTVIADGTPAASALRTGTPVAGPQTEDPAAPGPGPSIAVPLGDGRSQRGGVLLLTRPEGGTPFTPEETEALLTYAGQAALALELADRRRDAEHLILLEDRDRIARDLHDLAIQRLFATGMTLQSAARLVEHPGAVERLERAVTDLDETIRIIRSTIFGLRVHDEHSGAGLRSRATAAVGEAAAALGFPPRLSMEGLLDTDVPARTADDIMAALTELLSNAARHAHATRVDVRLRASADDVELIVSDDGRGLPAGCERSGLHNLAERADKAGGGFRSGPGPEGGARFVWHAPLQHTARTGPADRPGAPDVRPVSSAGSPPPAPGGS